MLQEDGGETHAVLAATCEANRIDDIIVEIHNTGAELVTIHDRPEGSMLGKYNYIIEVENKNGVTDKLLEKLGAIEDVRILGRFRVAEKQTESHTG
jgi:prephenate dehydratase